MIRILVAEEEEALRTLLSEELQEEGYEVLAIPPEFLWKHLAANEPSLVLSSQKGLTRRHLSYLKGKDLPVLAYGSPALKPPGAVHTAYEGPNEVEFDLERIKLKIHDLLGRSQWPHDKLPEGEKPPRTLNPRAQMSFSFHWGGKRS